MSIVINFIALVSYASAASICPDANLTSRRYNPLLTKVVEIDKIKPMGLEKFSDLTGRSKAEIDKSYDFVNTFRCEGSGQAVVYNSDHVIVPNHFFYKDGDCNKPIALSKCLFIYQGGGKKDVYKAKKIVKHGPCESKDGLKDNDDWAVVQLAKKLPPSIVPAEVASKDQFKVGDAVTISGRNGGYNPNKVPGDLSNLPKAYANCVAMGRSNFKYEGQMQSNCPADHGCSGCAITTQGENPKLLGIMLGAMPTDQFCSSDGDSWSGGFILNCRGTRIKPIEGEFRAALESIP